MRARKLLWIYAGIPVDAGMALVRPWHPPRRLAPGARLLLVGDQSVLGIAPPMARLARENDVAFLADGRAKSRFEEWATQPWLAEAVAKFQPTLVLASLGTNEKEIHRSHVIELGKRLSASAPSAIWIAPPHKRPAWATVIGMLAAHRVATFPSAALSLQRGPDGVTPTAMAFAGWAGATVRWIG